MPAINYAEILESSLARARAEAVRPKGPTGGCGRVYIVPAKEHKKGLAEASKTLGLTWLKKAHGTSNGVLYLGYDNASGLLLAQGEILARLLKEAGVECYRDEVGD